ncbi:MAG: tetratricopeptide repeat protein [Methylococcaceae bacterium]|jgi:tetratricopeptide (TPR) repeat protein
MKKIVFVVLLLLPLWSLAASLNDSLNDLESEWAQIYYGNANDKEKAYIKLLDKAAMLAQQYPNAAEALIWQANIMATYADIQDAISALDAIYNARKLLNQAIAINPKALDGSAFVTLGTLYYMAPKWPIAFGDSEQARQLLETALAINPNGIDSNYFYGDFLLTANQPNEAIKYFETAANAPIRAEQSFADTQLQAEAKIALKNVQERKISRGKNIFRSLFNSASLL